MTTAHHYRLWTILATILLGVFPASLFAESTAVSNQISVSSNSGGNTSENGTVVTGTSQKNVSVKTTINGEVVEDFSAASSDDISYMYSTSTVNGSVKTEVRTQSSPNESYAPSESETAISASESKEAARASSTGAVAATSSTRVSFISNLLAKIFAYVSFWISFR